MNLHAIFHQTNSEYSYQISENVVHILLRVATNDIKSVQLIHGDPFYWSKQPDGKYTWDMNKSKMNLKYQDDLFDYFFLELTIPSKRVRYSFLVEGNNGKQIIYHAKGFSKVPKPLIFTNLQIFFNIPYLHLEDMTNTPKWVKDTIWYQIFPDRFYNLGNKSKHDWNNEIVKNDQIYGGNLKGITSKLEYIKSLGCNGIYLTPIFKANTAHKYDTVDYFKIDPSFGTNQDFKELVERAHELGIKVMLDGVFNHAGFYHEYFLDIAKNGLNSPYHNAFKITKWPAVDFEFDKRKHYRDRFKIPNYETFATTSYMPKWNFESKITEDYLLKVVEYWITEYNIDAWRLDVSNEISFEFLRKIKKTARKANPDTYILGENWDQSLPWLKGDTLDGVMNYFLTTIIWDFIDLKIDNHEFRNRFTNYLVGTPKNIINNQFNLISSHDTERIKHRTNGDIRRVKIAFILLLLSQGTPCIYYGDEIGLDGAGDPDNRRLMIWNQENWDHDLLNFIKTLILIRKKHHIYDKEMKVSEFNDILILETPKLTVVINNSNQSQKLNIKGRRFDLIENREINFYNVKSIEPFSFYILKGGYYETNH